MKKIILFICMALAAGACEEQQIGDKGKWVFLNSCIVHYFDGALIAGYVPVFGELNPIDFIQLNLDWRGETVMYISPDVGGTGESAERFLEISKRNGDRSYNREETWLTYSGRRCCADNFSAIHVVCLNAAWDISHPAGTLLDDLFEVSYDTFAPYVRSGYQMKGDSEYETVQKRLSELKEGDLAMIHHAMPLYFDHPSEPGTYELRITMVTTEGAEKTATCTVEIE